MGAPGLRPFGSVRIIEDPNALEETSERLFPTSRHRSARVLKKLLKRHGGEFRKRPAAFHNILTGILIVHPAIAAQIRMEIRTTMDIQEQRALRGAALGLPLF